MLEDEILNAAFELADDADKLVKVTILAMRRDGSTFEIRAGLSGNELLEELVRFKADSATAQSTGGPFESGLDGPAQSR